MKQLHTEILVIGGGATGSGVFRDLAMRGFRTILVEARDLTHGTTGRFHGLLHSGGRYAVKDPQAAQECIEENRILRQIMPHCIEDTGGFFVATPDDDPGYADSLWVGCQQAGIPVEDVAIHQMLADEPYLNPEITRCLRVPDAAVDSFTAAHANAASAREHGGQALMYHEVLHLLTAHDSPQTAVIGARCHDLIADEHVTIYADLVVNAAGAWAGKIGGSVGIEIAMRPGKGTMLAVSHRVVNTVINRCKMPGDGDILVPAHTVAVMGTTDQQIPNPDKISIEPWEVQLMLAEGEKLIPGFSKLRMLRAWAGVRPLYQETKSEASRDITRSYVLLDHETRDGVPGVITITSGKWTTYRKMAEAAVDLACEKLETQRACRTHLEALPTAERHYHTLGKRLARIESQQAYGDLICECELATRADIEQAIRSGEVHALDDIRRDVRLGMGPCQGGFCTLRAAGLLHQYSISSAVETSNVALRDFLEERWKGVLPVLWGKQLQQERLNELIYMNVLNINALPGLKSSRLAAQAYERGERKDGDREKVQAADHTPQTKKHHPSSIINQRRLDVLVIGAGLAGLTAGWQAACRGLKTKVIAKGWGSTHWASGCIDVLNYDPNNNGNGLANPAQALEKILTENPHHPYARIGLAQLGEALRAFQELCASAGYPIHGNLEENWLLPTALGTVRPTCLAPTSMIAGDLRENAPILLIGFEGYLDFFPQFAAANLQAQGFEVQAVTLPTPTTLNRKRIDTMTLARAFENAKFRQQAIALLRPHLGSAARIGFPAVLGLQDAAKVVRELESGLGRRVFELPGLPPSIPGMRLQRVLVNAIRQAGGEVHIGMAVTSAMTDNAQRIVAVYSEAAKGFLQHSADEFVLASGGILGGGITTRPNGSALENVFGLEVVTPPQHTDWLGDTFAHPEGHAIFRSGVATNRRFRTPYQNLFVIGNVLDGGDFIREGSLEGVAIASGYLVAKGMVTQ